MTQKEVKGGRKTRRNNSRERFKKRRETGKCGRDREVKELDDKNDEEMEVE